MDTLQHFFDLNFPYIIIGIFISLMAFQVVYKTVEWFCSTVLKIEFKRTRERREEHETIINNSERLTELEKQRIIDTENSNRNDKEIIKDLAVLTNTVVKMNDKLDEMITKDDESEMTKLKDKLIQYYNRYKEIGEWTELESEAFWDLFKSYEDPEEMGICTPLLSQ